MSPTEVFLCYGIFVSGQSLLAATSTWTKIVRTINQLDAIQRKRTKPGLTAIVYSIPPEIWDMIELHLFDMERPVVEADIVKEILCQDCRNQAEEPEKALTFDYLNPRLSYERDSVKACDSCKSAASDFDGLYAGDELHKSSLRARLMAQFSRPIFARQACRELLQRYKLAFPLADYFDSDGSDGGHGEVVNCAIFPTTYVLICLPSETYKPIVFLRDSPDINVFDGNSAYGPVIHELDVGLPSDAADRFKFAVERLRLEPVWRRDQTIGRLVRTPEHDSDSDDDDESVPRWRLIMRSGGRSGFW